jgi:hypothetical protein
MRLPAAEAVVQAPLDASNARDLARFTAVYGGDVWLCRPPSADAFVVGGQRGTIFTPVIFSCASTSEGTYFSP